MDVRNDIRIEVDDVRIGTANVRIWDDDVRIGVNEVRIGTANVRIWDDDVRIGVDDVRIETAHARIGAASFCVDIYTQIAKLVEWQWDLTDDRSEISDRWSDPSTRIPVGGYR